MTGYVGETGLVPAVETAAYLNQRVGRIATKSGLTDLGYVYCVARSPAFKEFAEAQSHGSAQANVSGASLMAFPTVIAPAPLLEHFNSTVFGMLEGILANHEQAQTLATLRDTLLPRLISGKLRLPEAEALIEEAC
jgi:type I restriction enzyme S subunit